MSLFNYVPEKNRVYVRRFDHDDARRRHAVGERIADLAREYGVTAQAVYVVVTPGQQERELEMSRRWRTGKCESCGNPAMRLVGSKALSNPDGRTLCCACRGKAKRKRLGLDAAGVLVLRCAGCSKDKPLDEYGPRTRRAVIDGRVLGKYCRSCEAEKRQAYRDRHKVPCERCGQPCLPPNEKGVRGVRRALCRPCYLVETQTDAYREQARARALASVVRRNESNRTPAAVTAEAVSPRKETGF